MNIADDRIKLAKEGCLFVGKCIIGHPELGVIIGQYRYRGESYYAMSADGVLVPCAQYKPEQYATNGYAGTLEPLDGTA